MITSKEQKIVDNVAMDASFSSDQISILRFNSYALQYTFLGTPAGTLKVQVSCDEMGVSSALSSWDDLDDSSYTVSAAGTLTQNINQANYGKIRIVYTRSSSDGYLTVKMVAKNQG